MKRPNLRQAMFSVITTLFVAGCGGTSCGDVDCQDSMTVVFLGYDEWNVGSYRLVIDGFGECTGEVVGSETDAAFVCTDDLVSFAAGNLIILAKVDTMNMETYIDGNLFGYTTVNPDYERPQPECHPECRQSHNEIPG